MPPNVMAILGLPTWNGVSIFDLSWSGSLKCVYVGMKRTAIRLCVTNVRRDGAITCVLCRDIHLKCFLVLYKKICLKGGEV